MNATMHTASGTGKGHADPAINRRARRRWICVCLWLVAGPGCGPEGGALLYYFSDVGRNEKVQAEFVLGAGPVLVFVDDINGDVTWPEATDLLESSVSEELLTHDATEKVLAPDALRRLRQTRTDFDDMYCNEIGRKIGADQILWLEVEEFFASTQTQDLTAAAKMAVTVKVINPHGTRRDGTVRLWPENPQGHPVMVELSANEVSKERGRRAIATALTKKLATEVARLFYEHKLEDIADPIDIRQ